MLTKISERLQEGMILRNLKQVDIVEKTGINKGALSSYLSGRYKPKQDNIYLLAKALDVSGAWLMGYDVPIERKEFFSMQVSKKEKDLLVQFNTLNSSGQDKAIDYVADLADNPKYQKEDAVQEASAPYIPEVMAAHHPTGKLDALDKEDVNDILQYVAKEKKKKGLL